MMPTIHEKLKVAFIHRHPDDGPMLSVATRSDQRFDMALSPAACSALLGQLAAVLKETLAEQHAAEKAR